MTAPIWNFLNTDRAPDYAISPDVQQLLDRGAITRALTPARYGQNEGGEFNLPAYYSYQPNPALMPQTRYGSVLDVRPYDVPSSRAMGGWRLKNPNLWYNDPYYGEITPTANTIDQSLERDWMDYVGPLVVGGVMAGAGLGMLGPVAAGQGSAFSLGQTGMGLARSLGSGAPINPVSTALSLATPFANNLGIPAEFLQGAKLANTGYNLYNAYEGVQQPRGGYYPDLYGDMKSLPLVQYNGQLAAKSLVPNAYDNSYGANGTNSQVIA